MIKKLKLLSLLLFPLSIFINTVLSRYPHFIEKYYKYISFIRHPHLQTAARRCTRR